MAGSISTIRVRCSRCPVSFDRSGGCPGLAAHEPLPVRRPPPPRTTGVLGLVLITIAGGAQNDQENFGICRLGCIADAEWLVAGSSFRRGGVRLIKGSDDCRVVFGVHLVNPHSSLKLDVKSNDGSTTEWTFTGGSVTVLANLRIGKEGPNALNPETTSP